MLVMSRKLDQELVIGNGDIRIKVVEIRGDKVRLGVSAPREIPVHRAEIYDRIISAGEMVPNVSIAPSLRRNGFRMNREQAKAFLVSGQLQAFIDGRLQEWKPAYEYEGETVPGRWVTVEEIQIDVCPDAVVRVKEKKRRVATEADSLERRKCVAGAFGGRELLPGTLIYFDGESEEKKYHVKLDSGHFDWFENCFIDEEMSDDEPPTFRHVQSSELLVNV